MQDTGNAFEIKRPATLNNLVCMYTHTHTHTHTLVSKPPVNHKPKIYNRYTDTKENNPNTTLKTVIK